MNFHKTKIEWCSHTWNPVSGCWHGCAYCYARRIADRFAPRPAQRPMIDEATGDTGITMAATTRTICEVTRPVKLMDETGEFIRTTPYPMGFVPTFNAHILGSPAEHPEPARVFVCSMADLFGEWVPDKWIEAVLDSCKAAPQHTYLFLTKNPARYLRLAGEGKLPTGDNFWYGSTVTRPEDTFWWSDYHRTFVSVEPMLAPFEATGDEAIRKVDWVIIGAMTGPGSSRHQPRREWIEALVSDAQATETPVFMKDSLVDIWGRDLIREYPAGMAVEKPKQPVPRCSKCEHCDTVQQGARGKSRSCMIGWDAEGYDDRGPRHIEAHLARTSPPWCPLREASKDAPAK